MGLAQVQIVLSRPSEPRNVGAVCRAMKNAGLSRLVIVTDSEVDFDAARPLAVDARDVLDRARVTGSLPDALSDSSLAAGVTRRVGQRRKFVSFTPWQLAGKVVAENSGTISIVFGNEQSGLSDEELGHCHMAVGIPSSPELPSLNLSHAVQIITYELYLAELARAKAAASTGDVGDARRIGHEPVDSVTLSGHVDAIVRALAELGFQTQDGPQGMPAFLSDILGRAMLTEAEAARLVGMFEKLEGMHGR